MQHRRTFIATLGAATVQLLSAGRIASAARGFRRIEKIGVQLYTVRELMRRDPFRTLETLAEIGYREVEFAGYFGRSAAELRTVLDRLGLTAPSAHVPVAQLAAPTWRRTLDDAAALGHRYVTVPWLPEEDRRSVDAWKRTA